MSIPIRDLLQKKEQGTYFYIFCSGHLPYLNDMMLGSKAPTKNLENLIFCSKYKHFDLS